VRQRRNIKVVASAEIVDVERGAGTSCDERTELRVLVALFKEILNEILAGVRVKQDLPVPVDNSELEISGQDRSDERDRACDQGDRE